uniref:Uncharacterized protein n=1 Tax=Anguilla anguilla TaxID=7936 RepID=A0A0E9SY46_ANGAN
MKQLHSTPSIIMTGRIQQQSRLLRHPALM